MNFSCVLYFVSSIIYEKERKKERKKERRKLQAKEVVAQLVEWLLPTPDIRGLNPVIGKIYIERLLDVNYREKTKKRPVMAHLKK